MERARAETDQTGQTGYVFQTTGELVKQAVGRSRLLHTVEMLRAADHQGSLDATGWPLRLARCIMSAQCVVNIEEMRDEAARR